MTIIDAHQHFWDPGMFDYFWMEPGILQRAYLPADLRPILDEVGVQHTVLVQAQQNVAETRWFLELAEQNEFIAGVVGWVDLTTPDLNHTLDNLQKHPRFKAVRHMVQDEADPSWLMHPDALAGLRELAARGIAYDVLIRPPSLPTVAPLAEQIPDLRMVVDHIAKPPIASRRLDGWADHMAQIAQCPNVWCKVSGMITEADHATWKASDLKPYVQSVLSQFGADRLLYGSDWPVCLLAGSYRQVWDALHEALGPLSGADHAKIFGENAKAFYRLEV